MSLYVIADLHLSTLEKTNKSMEVFGKRWAGYTERLKSKWEHLVTESDTVVIPGDVSWALSLDEAVSDLKFIDALPGKKLLLKGNHDFWWCTMNKHKQLFEREAIKTIDFVFNNAHYADGLIIAGTRGWWADCDARGIPKNTDFLKLVRREEMRLKASLDAAKKIQEERGGEIIAFMHFPPYFLGKAQDGMIEILNSAGVRRVYYGHVHGSYQIPPVTVYGGIEYHLISADYLDFTPKIIKPMQNGTEKADILTII